VPEFGRHGLRREPGRDLRAGVKHVRELVAREIVDLGSGLDQRQRTPDLGPRIVSPVARWQHGNRSGRQAGDLAHLVSTVSAAGRDGASRGPSARVRPRARSRCARGRGGGCAPAVGHEVSGAVGGGCDRDRRELALRIGARPVREGQRHHQRPGRQALRGRQHRPDQCLRPPDHLSRTRDERQQQQPRPQLPGQVLELTDLPPADRRSGRESEHRSGPELCLRAFRRDHQPPERAVLGRLVRGQGPREQHAVGRAGRGAPLGDREHRQGRALGVGKQHSVGVGGQGVGAGRQRDGDRPRGAVGQRRRGLDRGEVGQGQESAQRRERTGQYQLEVADLAFVQRQRGERGMVEHRLGLRLCGHFVLRSPPPGGMPEGTRARPARPS